MEGLHTPHKVKSAVAGCPRNCSEAYVKDIGLVAVEGGWEIYVGGAAGGTVRKGDLLARTESAEEASQIALAFLQHYREHGEHLERTYGFLERVGLDAVRDAVLPEERMVALLERFAIAKAACDPDPWRERREPVHPKQFSELDSEPLDLDLVAVAAGGAAR
jgi:nitrite reductase (NADH) large subunit